jgi:phage tail sheath gpL-like
MALQIPILGVPQDFRRPGSYLDIKYNQGAAGAFAPGREVVFVMPKTSAGNWTVNTLYAVPDEATVITGGGTGSPIHRACRKFRQVNRDAKLWAVVYNASSGGSPATATGTIVITGPATADGNFDVIVAGVRCSTGFQSGDDATAIGDAVAAAINGQTHLPVTAANVTGTVTLTARIAGASQGTGALAAYRLHTEITLGSGVTAVTSSHIGAATAGADGSTTEAANQLTALGALDAVRKYWVGISTQASTEYGQLATHIRTKSEPRRGLRSAGICAYTGSLANAQTLAIARNYERLTMVWQLDAEACPAELVGAAAAIFQKEEQLHTATNFDGYSLSDIIPNAYATTSWPDAEDENDAINDGLMAIGSSDAGPYIVMATTTRSKASGGVIDDPRSLERHRVAVSDEFCDEELSDFKLNYSNKRLKDDELLNDGKFNPNQKTPPGVVTPSGFKPHILARYDDYEAAGKLQNVAQSKQALRVVKTGSRLEVGGELNSIDLLHQATYLFAEVSQG